MGFVAALPTGGKCLDFPGLGNETSRPTTRYFLTWDLFNVASSRFLKSFPQSKRYIVNVSSLMAVQGFPGFSLYCTGKAARDMLHEVIAKEEVKLISYLILTPEGETPLCRRAGMLAVPFRVPNRCSGPF